MKLLILQGKEMDQQRGDRRQEAADTDLWEGETSVKTKVKKRLPEEEDQDLWPQEVAEAEKESGMTENSNLEETTEAEDESEKEEAMVVPAQE